MRDLLLVLLFAAPPPSSAPPGMGAPGLPMNTAPLVAVPIVHMQALPSDAGGPSRLLSESLPRNTSFVVEMPATVLTQSGLLRVWPGTQEEPDCNGAGGKQSYCLPMSLEMVQGRPVLRTMVPQLQSGVPFQFKIEQYESLPPETAGSLAKGVAALILTTQETAPDAEPPPCDMQNPYAYYKTLPKVTSTSGKAETAAGIAEALGNATANDEFGRESLEAALAKALAAEMDRRKIAGDPAGVARLAVDDFFVTSERRTYLQRDQELDDRLQTLKIAQEKLCKSFGAAGRMGYLRTTSPTVYVDGKLRGAADYFDKRHAALLADAPLYAGASQLSQWKADAPPMPPTPIGSPPAVRPEEPWRAALQLLLELDPAERAREAAKVDKSAFPSQQPVALWSPVRQKLISISAAVSEFEKVKPESIRLQIEAIRPHFPESQQSGVSNLIQSLRDLAEDQEKRNKAKADVDLARAGRDQAFQQIREALVRSLNSVPVTSALRTMRRSEGRSDPKLLRTPSAGSFASPDIGAFAAAPVVWRKGSDEAELSGGQTWVLPYVGLNLYLEPVERDLPLEQLVPSRDGRWFDRQRWSGTIGFVFRAQPDIPGRRVESGFLSAYPVVGIGYRVTPYLRVTGGAVGYYLLDANPASNRKSPAAAPFIGASIDTDLAALLFNAMNPKK